MASDEVLIQTAISSWEQVIKRVGTLCLSCSEEQLLVEVAPGKNRSSYVWGHLTAVNDAMFSVLRGWESGYTRNWTPSSSRNRTDPSRFQPPPRLPSVGRMFTPNSFRDSRRSALRSG
jgi:hypothetical protein